jgi:hypothetical protein
MYTSLYPQLEGGASPRTALKQRPPRRPAAMQMRLSSPQRPALAWAHAALLVLLAACACSLLLAPAASATDYTWSGEGATSADDWSNGANWAGGVAPIAASSIGTMTFPLLANGDCTTEPSTGACYHSVNDLTGLSVNQLQLNNGVVLGNPETFFDYYRLSGDGITLGSGGLSASSPANANLPRPFYLELPITLGASQTWSLTGPPGGGVGTGGNVIAEALSGSSADLTINLSDSSGLYLQGDNEVGNVSVKAGDAASGSINLLGEPGHVYQLDATDGHTVTVSGVDLAETNTALGALVSIGAYINVGWPYATNPGTLNTTSASFDATSDVDFEIAEPGTTAGTDYAQLTSTGPVQLGGSSVELFESLPSGECPALQVGYTYTLISTTGGLSGAFGNAPEGSVIHDGLYCNNTYRINYHETGPTQTVTATVVSTSNGSAPSNTELPQITGKPAVGETLTTTIGAWSGDTPQDYHYEWLRDGTPIPEATSYTYVVTPTDQGHQLAVKVTASNKNGSASATSAAISIPSSSQPGEEEPPSGGSNPPPSTSQSSTPITSTSMSPSTVSQPSDTPQVVKSLTTAQKLAKALKVCKREKPARKRKACEAQARRRYRTKEKKGEARL